MCHEADSSTGTLHPTLSEPGQCSCRSEEERGGMGGEGEGGGGGEGRGGEGRKEGEGRGREGEGRREREGRGRGGAKEGRKGIPRTAVAITVILCERNKGTCAVPRRMHDMISSLYNTTGFGMPSEVLELLHQ